VAESAEAQDQAQQIEDQQTGASALTLRQDGVAVAEEHLSVDQDQLTIATEQNMLGYYQGKVASPGNHDLDVEQARVNAEAAQVTLSRDQNTLIADQADLNRAVAFGDTNSPQVQQDQAQVNADTDTVNHDQANVSVAVQRCSQVGC
jgi:hypothetical protein